MMSEFKFYYLKFIRTFVENIEDILFEHLTQPVSFI